VTCRSLVAQLGVPLAPPDPPDPEPPDPDPAVLEASADGVEAELGVAAPDAPGAPEEADAAADAAAGDDDEEDEGEDVHPAIKAPKPTKAVATSGVVVRRSIISAIPLSATSQRHPGRHPLTYP
jgi:hypothetical protein